MKSIQKLKSIYQKAETGWLWRLRSQKKDVSYMGNLYGGYGVKRTNLGGGIIYSFGIGEDISFELACIESWNVEVYAFDPTPKSISWMNRQRLPEGLRFYPCGIAVESGEMPFYMPKHEEYVSGSLVKNEGCSENTISVSVKSLPDIMEELGHDRIDILKMDVEGLEYSIIPDLLERRVPVNQICFESHHRMLADGKQQLKNVEQMLKDNGYQKFFTSWRREEFGYIKK